MPTAEHAELVGLLRQRGLSDETSTVVANELTEHDALRTHLSVELGIDQEDLANPWAASISSAVAFAAGAVLPLVAILVPPASVRIAIAFAAVLVALCVTGVVSARLGGSPARAAVIRLVGGGALAMAVTFGLGQLLGVATG
jgi:VIT1/CCC1 family predicted Fe2+/Mn2+ transporter